MSIQDAVYKATALPAQILACREKGIAFAPASGRQYSNLRKLFAPVADRIDYICENGAVLYRGQTLSDKISMPRKRAEELIGYILEAKGCEVVISGADTSYLIPKDPEIYHHVHDVMGNHTMVVPSVSDIQEDILKVAAFCRDGAANYTEILGKMWKKEFKVALSGEKWLDFTIADKGMGVENLCRKMGITLQEVMAFGDNYNDLPMLRLVGYPYIIRDSVLDKAGYGKAICREEGMEMAKRADCERKGTEEADREQERFQVADSVEEVLNRMIKA